MLHTIAGDLSHIDTLLVSLYLSAVKVGIQKYWETDSRSDINNMFFLKDSTKLLDKFKSRSIPEISSIKIFDYSTLYTIILHVK